MAGYLGKTHEKVDALVRAAVLEGVEGNRVIVVSVGVSFSSSSFFQLIVDRSLSSSFYLRRLLCVLPFC